MGGDLDYIMYWFDASCWLIYDAAETCSGFECKRGIKISVIKELVCEDGLFYT
jgi:hypothetical protein